MNINAIYCPHAFDLVVKTKTPKRCDCVRMHKQLSELLTSQVLLDESEPFQKVWCE